ncbi:MAG: hypothetical protein AAFQ40_00415 [Cyanobacteria bacterium J06623_5]
MSQTLWDIAGIDALSVARTLFGESVGYLAPFQSLETNLKGTDCSVLRLCDRNFRVLCSDDLEQAILLLNCNVSVHQYNWLASFSLGAHQLKALAEHATVRPPHRLINLPNHQAVPAQLEDIAMLIWRHSSLENTALKEPILENPTLDARTADIHTACANLERLKELINNL